MNGSASDKQLVEFFIRNSFAIMSLDRIEYSKLSQHDVIMIICLANSSDKHFFVFMTVH